MSRIPALLPAVLLPCAALLVSCAADPVAPQPQPGTQQGAQGGGIRIPAEAANRIGRRIWQNECAGSVEGLTSWNAGEGFASLGIAHFIWYPAGVARTYEESFPRLMQFLASRGAPVAPWMRAPDCPWRDRASFQAAQNGAQLRELRTLLSSTVGLQAEFAAMRATAALAKLEAAAPAQARGAVRQRFHDLAATPGGLYCLMDYVNFKGEGTNPAEAYRGQGWGLLQVLMEMQGDARGAAACAEFSAAAKRVLGRRISLAPKDETRWRAGWFNRCDSYARGL